VAATTFTGESRPSHHASTGIAGLDYILGGGFARDHLYLIEGVPGSGKTTLALQFLAAGARLGEPTLYVTLSETKAELSAVARSHGWSLDDITVHELVPSEDDLQAAEQYTIFHPSEVELSATLQPILETVERLKPTRVVIDSLSELRLLGETPLRYRRQILALKSFFSGRRSTVVLLDDQTGVGHDLHVQSIAHGVIMLEQLSPDYGSSRRRLRVVKYRAQSFRGGYHDYEIRQGGLEVFPRLIAAEHRTTAPHHRLPSGIDQLDQLLGGGIEQGTSTLIVGAPGTGKSSLASQFVAAGVARGQSAAMFLFDESMTTLLSRSAGLGTDLKSPLDAGLLTIQQVDPAELSPGEFAHALRRAVAHHHAQIIVIDSLNGYLNAMPGEHYLIVQLHELLSYLGQNGVATILIGAHHGLIGGSMQTPVDASYLADAVVLLRYFEAAGEVRQAISVVKKRGGSHERTIREFGMRDGSIHVGEPLRHFRGVLTGVPSVEHPRPSSPSMPSS
jgi:circadian clock protein KaiC